VPLRADEEQAGGIIHKPIFERFDRGFDQLVVDRIVNARAFG
jgi:hypothetical protein